jgi:type VI secretion system protein ImpL
MAILAWFVSPLFLTLLGMSATGVLIWFAGQFLRFGTFYPLASGEYRLLVIVALLIIWGVNALISALIERRQNRQMVEQLAATTDAETAPDSTVQATAEELQVLRDRFSQALATLKGAEGKRTFGGRWVYQLPWYLIIGPPGCGKTTALLNAGLRFPLAERLGQDAVAGFGGTRHCDWWFTDAAVLIDTAGRYTTQDSDRQVDKSAWLNFLALLKKYRPRRPINGVLVALSLADVLQQPQVDRERQALAIRQRVQELCQNFHTALPVYVLLMKTDLIAGFNEFFADLGKDGREQVWGMTFPLALEAGAPTPISAVGTELTLLQQRLEQQVLARLEQEREPSKRTFLFSFPTQFTALSATLEPFLIDIFTPSRFEIQPLLRGVYFTSGTQTGTPIDRILGAYAANFGLGRTGALPFKGTSKSYFLTRLLREVVFPEAGLVGLDPLVERRRRWLQRGAFAVIGLIFVATAAAWTTSYLRNQALIVAVEQQVTQLEAQLASPPSFEKGAGGSSVLAVLPLLDGVRSLPFGFAQRQLPVDWTLGLGLYQGDKLGSQAQRAYFQMLERVLLPRIVRRLEEQLRQASADPKQLYETLRVYLLLGQIPPGPPFSKGGAAGADFSQRSAAGADFSQGGDDELPVSNSAATKPFEKGAPSPPPFEKGGSGGITTVKTWIERDWQQNLPTTTTRAQHEALRSHLAALLEQRAHSAPLLLNQAAIDAAREILNRAPLTERLYEQLKREGVGAELREFTISAAAGEYASLVLVRRSGRPLNQGIPALYTFDGYHQGFVPTITRLIDAVAADSWVLGAAAQVQPGSVAAAQLLAAVRERYLQDYVTAWTALLEDVALLPVRDLPHAAQMMDVLADPATSPLRLFLMAAAQQTQLDRPAAPASAAAPAVPDLGQRVAGFVSGTPAAPALKKGASGEPPERYVTRRFTWLHDLVRANAQGQTPLDQMQTTLSALALHVTAVAAAMAAGRTVAVGGEAAEIAAVKALANKLPTPVGGLVATLAQDSALLEAGGIRAQLNRQWTTEVLPFCREAINDRYPFVKDSARETTLFDFGKLLGPGGMIEGFFQQHLAPLVNTSRPQWTWADNGIGIPLEVLAQFQRALALRNTFFASEGKLPAVAFALQPLRMEARAIQFLLDLDGQIVDYRQGPPRSQQLQWPVPEGTGRVRLAFTDTMGISSSVTEEGAWAWFRMLERSALKPTAQAEKFQLTFKLGELTAQFELRAVSVRNPFNVQEVRAFRCPERL